MMTPVLTNEKKSSSRDEKPKVIFNFMADGGVMSSAAIYNSASIEDNIINAIIIGFNGPYIPPA